MNSDRKAHFPGATSSNQAEFAARELISRIYDVAIDPDRVGALVSFWAEQVEKNSDGLIIGDAGESGGVTMSDLFTHIERAEDLLKSALLGHRSTLESLNTWVQQKRHAAFALTRTGQIVAANRAALIAFGVAEGGNIQHIAVAGDVDLLALIASTGAFPKIVRLRGGKQQESYSAVLKYPVVSTSDCVGVIADFIEWPHALTLLLQSTYRLTMTEIEVLQALITTSLTRRPAASLPCGPISAH